MLDNKNNDDAKSFLQRLRSDKAGNTFAMAAAAMFPIAGVIGGGVDIGRAYMAKARLQQACDAGALAGRRMMSGATMSAQDKVEARKYFDFNFPEGTFGTSPFQDVDGQSNPRFVDGPSGSRTVNGFAETTIDTSIMQIFGYDTMSLKVDCTSRLDIGNVDVVMALDVTGSMGGTRIQGLREAVKEFYDVLGPGGGTSGSQVRYGFVPYNAHVNVGKLLYDENPAWLVGGTGTAIDDEWNYQTRRAIWNLPVPDPIVTYETINVAGASGNDRNACKKKFGVNLSTPPLWNPSDSGYPTGNDIMHNGDYYEFSFYSYNRINKNNKICTRKVERWEDGPPGSSQSHIWEPGATFSHFEYDEFKHDVSGYVASINSGTAVTVPTLWDNPNNNTHGPTDTWDGCIEERDTYSDIISTTNAIPDNAYDLDIDLIPENTATRWRPSWPAVEYWRSGSKPSTSSCPKPSRRLAEYQNWDGVGTDGGNPGTQTQGNLKSYIDGLNASGFTNHTIGMIWAARLISGEGLFGTVNSSTKNGFNISRHILFMTDGSLNVNPNHYNVYGLNELDGRLGPTNINKTELMSRQAQRFQLICNAAKAKGITVWVIQFGVSNTTSNMENCATSEDHAEAATSNAALKDAFGNIAKTIGGLRLSK